MKLSTVVCAVLIPGLLAGADALVRGGKAVSEIVLENKTSNPQLVYAADELAKWTEKITGARIPVKDAPSPAGVETVVRIGTPADSADIRANASPEALKRIGKSDGFAIEEKGNVIRIYGTKSKGVLNGVYRFLEKNTDIIWVRERDAEEGSGTIYGKKADLINQVETLVDVPVLPSHRFWTNHTRGNSVWQARLLNTFGRPLDGNMNPELYRFFRTVGDMTELSGTLGLDLLQSQYEAHPEYFPLVKGKRVHYHDCQLCFMNPETIKAFCAEAEKIVLGNPKKVVNYGIGLGDNWDVCECPLCTVPIVLPDGRKVMPEDKNFRSTQYAMFTNAVSDWLTKRFPYLNPIGAAAYLFTAEAPAVKVRGGGPTYCPYVKNHKKPVYDDSVNAVWHRKAESFRDAGLPAVALYEYYLCNSTPEFYHAISEVAQKDLLYYLPDLKGEYLDVVYGDTPDHDRNGVYDVSAIEFYVMSRLMWNPEIDVREARREFCRRAYREAAGPMTEYYEKLAENYNSDPAGCFWNDDPVSAANHYIVRKGLAQYVRAILKKAEAAAVHPGSRELIARHAARMNALIDKAEKLPPRITLGVPRMDGVPVTLDPDGPEWADAAEIPSFTAVGNPKKPSDHGVRVRIRHNRDTLFLLFDLKNPAIPGLAEKLDALPDKGLDPKRVFDWGNCMEMFIDGGLRTSGSYYHLNFMMNGRTYTGQGPAEMENGPKWTVRVQRNKDGSRFLAAIPLSEIGVNISQGNKIGAMFVGNGGAWNGGQWHSPTGFQTLQLNMD